MSKEFPKKFEVYFDKNNTFLFAAPVGNQGIKPNSWTVKEYLNAEDIIKSKEKLEKLDRLLEALKEADELFAGKPNTHTFTLDSLYRNYEKVRNVIEEIEGLNETSSA